MKEQKVNAALMLILKVTALGIGLAISIYLQR